MSKRAAFTLVELSIVLVILGLLVGGVLTGQSLIRAAELRSVATQQSRFQTAAMTFRDKYFALPGDMSNATAYWGIAAGSGSDSACNAQASTTTATCNGDGDGKVMNITGSNEPFRFWQQLANAGLIEGNYTGTTDGTTYFSATTRNVPTGRISSTLWFVAYWGQLTSNPEWFDANYGTAMEFGRIQTNADPYLAALKPEEAYNIDMKMDDGKPATGKVMIRVISGNLNACTDTSTTSNKAANYLLSNSAAACALIFPQIF